MAEKPVRIASSCPPESRARELEVVLKRTSDQYQKRKAKKLSIYLLSHSNPIEVSPDMTQNSLSNSWIIESISY